MGKKQDYWDTYDHVMDVFKLNNENYFKRTQILMILIQSVLFAALIKVISVKTIDAHNPELLSLSIGGISFMGICAAFTWTTLVTRQHQLLEYCRWYMRWIEEQLFEEGVPLVYFKYESKIFAPHRKKQKYFWHGDPCKGVFPQYKRKVRCGLMNSEGWIARSLMCFWIACLATFINNHWTDRMIKLFRTPNHVVFAISLLLSFIILIVVQRLYWKLPKHCQKSCAEEFSPVPRRDGRCMDVW